MKNQKEKNKENQEQQNTDLKIFYKVILIGDSLVGKTCLFKKLTKGIYSNKNISTIGMDQKSINLILKVPEKDDIEVEKNFTINLWDTAGQERFRSITSGYFKESHGLILLYDITNRTSFDNLEKWMDAVNDTLGNLSSNDPHKKYSVIVLGNKADLEDKRKVTYDEADEKCKQYNVYFAGECSVQEMNLDELNELFNKLIREIYKDVGFIQNKTPIVKKLSTFKKNKKHTDCLC